MALASFEADLISRRLGADIEVASPAQRMAAWDAWLIHNPNETEQARAQARDRELLEAV